MDMSEGVGIRFRLLLAGSTRLVVLVNTGYQQEYTKKGDRIREIFGYKLGLELVLFELAGELTLVLVLLLVFSLAVEFVLGSGFYFIIVLLLISLTF